MSALRPALRIARREAGRHKWRTFLVVALVAVPVAALVIGSAVVRTGALRSDVATRARFLGADAVVRSSGSALTAGAPSTAAGSDAQLAALRSRAQEAVPGLVTRTLMSGYGTVRNVDGQDLWASVTSGPLADPLLAPGYDVAAGRLPAAPGEVALSHALAVHLGADVDQDLDVPELRLHGRVVGIANSLGNGTTGELLTFTPPDLDPTSVVTAVYIGLPGPDRAAQADGLVAATNVEWPSVEVRDVGQVGGLSFGTASGYIDQAMLATFVGEAVGFAVLGLIISIAFTIGSRQQVRTLGLIAANGGSPRLIRAVVLCQGFWSGLVGALVGISLGLVGLALAWPMFRWSMAQRSPWWTISVGDIVVISLIGVLAAVGSSYLPARTASRLSVLQALAGRRPLPPVRPRLAFGGALVAACGLGALALAGMGSQVPGPHSVRYVYVLEALAIVGSLAVLAGSTLGAHVVVAAVGSLGGRLSGAPRLATRSLARQRTRYGSVVAGITAAATVALFAGAATVPAAGLARGAGLDGSRSDSPVPPNVVAVVPSSNTGLTPWTSSAERDSATGPVAALLPDARRVDIRSIYLGRDGFPFTGGAQAARVATPEVIDAIGLTGPQREALRDRGVIGLTSVPASASPEPLPTMHLFDQGALGRVVDVAWFDAEKSADGTLRSPYWLGESLVVSPEQLARFGIELPPISEVRFINPSDISPEMREAIAESKQYNTASPRFRLRGTPEVVDERVHATVTLPSDPPRDYRGLAELSINAAALLITGLIIAIGVALASADSREERDGLDALGAPPRLLRRVEGAKAATLALLGALIAVPTALLPALVLGRTTDSQLFASAPWSAFVPWRMVGSLVIGIPIAVGLITIVGSGVRSRFRPIAASQFSCD